MDGEDKPKAHGGDRLPQCVEITRQLQENDKYFMRHVDESGPIREAVARHDTLLDDLISLKRWLQTTVVGILGVAVLWGSLIQKVSRLEQDVDRYIYGKGVNSGRYTGKVQP